MKSHGDNFSWKVAIYQHFDLELIVTLLDMPTSIIIRLIYIPFTHNMATRARPIISDICSTRQVSQYYNRISLKRRINLLAYGYILYAGISLVLRDDRTSFTVT